MFCFFTLNYYLMGKKDKKVENCKSTTGQVIAFNNLKNTEFLLKILQKQVKLQNKLFRLSTTGFEILLPI